MATRSQKEYVRETTDYYVIAESEKRVAFNYFIAESEKRVVFNCFIAESEKRVAFNHETHKHIRDPQGFIDDEKRFWQSCGNAI
eukprot:15195278-Ditylum_brightwellii.AAC.1